MYKKLLFLVLVLSVSHSIFSQYNFTAGYPVVYNILNTKCSNTNCHSATSSQSLRFDTTASAVYAQIVGQPPVNSAALGRGEQLVWSDQPYQSYLLKKAGNWFDTDLGLPVAEPDSAAHSQASTGLSDYQVEYIRQWIMNAASETNPNIDTAIIDAYYNVYSNDTGKIAFFPKLAKPNASTGTQVRFGPIFVRNTPGNNEVEYMLVHQVNFPSNMEVIGVQSSMSSFSHHFLLFQFPNAGSATPYATGLRRVILSGGGTITPFDPPSKNLIAAWQTPSNVQLPTGTAFFWDQATYIDQDYHMINYTPITPGTSGVFPFDFYLNITYRPRVVSDNTIQMKSALINNPALVLLPHQSTTLPYQDQDNGNNEMRYIWLMSSHTHKFGTGFNIYTYDASKPNGFGDTLFKGTYDYTNGVDLGYYNWEHPPVEFFNPQLPMNMSTNGTICQTTWDNDSSSIVTFGFTSSNEMQLYYYMYTSTLPTTPTGIQNISKSAFDFVVYPNPMSSDMGTIAYTLTEAATINASILDITGKEVATLKDEKEQAGSYNVSLSEEKTLSSGMYFARMTVNGETYTKKFVIE